MANIKFVTVPWRAGGSHYPMFEDAAARTAYFTSLPTVIANANTSRIRMYNRFRAGGPTDELRRCNYAWVSQDGIDLFYFVDRVEYLSPEASDVSLSLDPIVTYMFDFKLEASFIDRGHVDKVNRSSQNSVEVTFSNCLESENIEAGAALKQILFEQLPATSAPPNVKWVWVISGKPFKDAQFHDKETTTSELVPLTHVRWGADQSIAVFCFPTVEDPSTGFTYTINGQTALPYAQLNGWIREQAEVADNIYTIFITPYCPFASVSGESGAVTLSRWATYGIIGEEGNKFGIVVPDYLGSCYAVQASTSNPLIKTFDFVNYTQGPFLPEYETKMYMPPYTQMSIDYLRANAIELNPAFVGGSIDVAYACAGGAVPKDAVFVPGYLNDTMTDGLNFDQLFPNDTLSEIPVPANEYNTYIYRQKASMITGIATSFGQSISMAAISGNGTGIAGAAISAAGSIANLVVKENELKKAPVQLRKPGNNYPFELSVKGFIPSLSVLQVPERTFERVALYFNQFGYSIKKTMEYDLRSRHLFNYVRTVDANITGPIGAEHLAEIRRIFDNGVTFWHLDRGAVMFDYTTYNNYEEDISTWSREGGDVNGDPILAGL